MDISEATEKFEALFGEVLIGLPQHYSQTGEEYTEVGNDGPRIDGGQSAVEDFATGKRVPGRTIHLTGESAIDQWLEQATMVAAPLLFEKPTLYWRIKPEVRESLMPLARIVWPAFGHTNGHRRESAGLLRGLLPGGHR